MVLFCTFGGEGRTIFGPQDWFTVKMRAAVRRGDNQEVYMFRVVTADESVDTQV